MEKDALMNKFGYSEMYEWSQIPYKAYTLGRFVQFSENFPSKIQLCVESGLPVVGVTTINAVSTSDNPDEWWLKNKFNNYGDVVLKNKVIAVGYSDYDDIEEMNIVKTRKENVLKTIDSELYDSSKKYKKRSHRPEWMHVTILGKCIVEDNGECKPGHMCTPVFSKDLKLAGTVQPANGDERLQYYVISRISSNTVMILFK